MIMPINVWDSKKGLYVPVGSIDDNWHELFSLRMPLIGHLIRKYRNLDYISSD